MYTPKKIELIGGLGTFAFGLVNSFISLRSGNRSTLDLWDYFFLIVIWTLIPALIAVGSYSHAVRIRKWGMYYY